MSIVATEDDAVSHAKFLRDRAAEYGIPQYMIGSLVQYILIGRPVGSFLTAVLNNDLRAAVDRGDETNQPIIHKYIKYLHNHAPMGCWGSFDSTQQWISRGGLFPHRQPMVTD